MSTTQYNQPRSSPESRWGLKRYQGPPLHLTDRPKNSIANYLDGFNDLAGKLQFYEYYVINEIIGHSPDIPFQGVYFRCECKQIPTIMLKVLADGTAGHGNHEISDDGTVMPSVGHGCGFHEWVRLENFQGVS